MDTRVRDCPELLQARASGCGLAGGAWLRRTCETVSARMEAKV